MNEPVLDAVRAVFRALATTVVPEAAHLDEGGWRALEGIVEDALAARPRALRRRLVTFVRLLEWLPLLRYGRRFTGLDPVRRAHFLAAVENAPVFVVRRGFWGLRTLILMGYYGRGEAAAEIGYRAHLRGWYGRGLGPGAAAGEEAAPVRSGSPGAARETDPAGGEGVAGGRCGANGAGGGERPTRPNPDAGPTEARGAG